jgi:hypothetical protein
VTHRPATYITHPNTRTVTAFFAPTLLTHATGYNESPASRIINALPPSPHTRCGERTRPRQHPGFRIRIHQAIHRQRLHAEDPHTRTRRPSSSRRHAHIAPTLWFRPIKIILFTPLGLGHLPESLSGRPNERRPAETERPRVRIPTRATASCMPI